MTTQLMTLEAAVCNITGPGDISGSCQKITLTAQIDEKDKTTFASLGWKEVTGGLASGSLSLDILNDLADNGLDEDMWTLFIARVPTDFYVKLDDAATSATNPAYYGKILVNKWTPISGAPGDLATASYEYPTSGAITRYVT